MAKLKKLWRREPARADLSAAQNYLSLLCPDVTLKRVMSSLAHASTSHAAAKDLLRASSLPLLARDESHVRDDLKRIHKGKKLSPVLLIRGDALKGRPLVVADGYHRICAICYFDEDAPIACRISELL